MMEAIPKRIIAGSTTTCRLTTGYSPLEGWALSLALRGGGEAVTVDGTADGDGFIVDIPATLAAGPWWWQVKVTDGVSTYFPESGELQVEANLFDVDGPHDGRSESRIALAAIDAVLANKATQDQQSYTIKGRSLVRYSMGELFKLRTHFALKVQREQGITGFRKVGVRF